MNGFPQKNESNNMNIIQARPLNSFQIPQIASPFPSQVFAGAPITNGVLGTNEFSQMQLNTGALPTGSVPVFLIPASSLTAGQQLSLNQSGINSVILQNQEQHDSKIQPQQAFLLKNNNFIQQPSPNNSIMSFNNVVPQSFLSSIPNINVLPGFNALKQNDQSIGNGDMTGNPWMNNIQQIQGSSPIIILSSNKPPTLQNQPTNFTSNNVNPGTMTTGTFITSNFSQGGNSMPGLVPYEQQPLQIQYLTSLYCPYSNNNIFSSGNPVIYQNNPVTPLQNSGKMMNGMENMTGSNGSFQPIQQVQNPGFMNNGMLGIPDNVREQNNALNRHERENGGNNGTF